MTDATIAELEGKIPTLLAAMEMQRRRIADVERAAIKPLTPLAAAVLDLTTQIQNEAVGEVEVALAALAPAFAKLIAVDQIQAATLGKDFPVPAGSVVPFKGFMVVQGTAKGIHERFRPAELEDRALLVAADAISAPIISQIKGK
ncbi:hypothetical protein [Sphingopyxis macrogoltabida]|uniref:hypothetical protein n=1 Tax=Sphingopyxis macrogoltabida TaxID=33050 RepID=UPI0012E1CD8F|nr:hypothetical protein [Sphingopyxis macrogoltabida]